MNTTMADGARERLVAQIGEALFGQPGLTLMELAEKVKASQPTPSSRWAANGEPDPHGSRYDCERAALVMGDLSDDELANAVFLHGNEHPTMAQIVAGAMLPIAYLTAAKDRIRWLSRALVAASAKNGAQPFPAGPSDALVETARRNVRQFISKASFSSSVDKQAALSCVDVLEAALADRQPMAAAVKNSLTVGGEPIAAPNRLTDQAQAVDLGTGVKAIAAERQRQMQAEGFTRDADQQYRRGELARAATAYVQLAAMDLRDGGRDHIAWHGPAAAWPWAPEWWKPVDARRDLVRAGALIAAQIDLIDSKAVPNG